MERVSESSSEAVLLLPQASSSKFTDITEEESNTHKLNTHTHLCLRQLNGQCLLQGPRGLTFDYSCHSNSMCVFVLLTQSGCHKILTAAFLKVRPLVADEVTRN